MPEEYLESKESEIDTFQYEDALLEKFSELSQIKRKVVVFHDILPRGNMKILMLGQIKAAVFDDRLGAFVVGIMHRSSSNTDNCNHELFCQRKQIEFISSLRDFSVNKYPSTSYAGESKRHSVNGTVPVHTLILGKADDSSGEHEFNMDLTHKTAAGEWQISVDVNLQTDFCLLWREIENMLQGTQVHTNIEPAKATGYMISPLSGWMYVWMGVTS